MRSRIKFLDSLFEVTHVEFQSYDFFNHKLVFSSGLTRRLLGYSEDEYIKLSNDLFKSIVHKDDFQKVQNTIKKIIKSKEGDVIEMAVRMRKSDGFYIWTYSRQMILEKNLRDHIFTIIREVEDITTLTEIQNELNDRVKQLRNVSLKNSHLLRAPVVTILGLIDLIEEQKITSKHNMKIFNFLKVTIKKLDDIIHEINDAAQTV